MTLDSDLIFNKEKLLSLSLAIATLFSSRISMSQHSLNKSLNKSFGHVYFVGAGPGDPELLTLKAAKMLQTADLVIYPGSLIPTEVFITFAPKAKHIDSAGLTLHDITTSMAQAATQGQSVCRLHTGDPSLFGTLREEITFLEEAQIPWAIIPGVTAACAAAAKAGISFSVPTVCQSLILTRLGGKTPMPAKEALRDLASSHTSMAIYLAGDKQEIIQQELLQSGLPKTTPILCAHRVGFPDEQLIWTTLEHLLTFDPNHTLANQTIFLILPAEDQKGAQSHLYHTDFHHKFRT